MEPGTASGLLGSLGAFGPVLAVKLYRLSLDPVPSIPILPCLDHEAMLHGGIAPHMAVYVQDAASGDIHELVFVPEKRRIEIDTVSTWGESAADSHARLLGAVKERFPGYSCKVITPSWWRGDRRVADSCRSQVTLRDVLLGGDVERIKAGIERLQAIAALMEKQSRVASWGVRTVTGPLIAASGVVVFLIFGALSVRLGEEAVTALRYTFIGIFGAWLVYYGLKAVQLTEMSNRVWKRTAEYNLILSERKRLGI